MKTLERFLEYIRIPTQSAEGRNVCPTTDKQFVLAHRLVQEMKEIGIADAYADEHCYVYGHIPATPGYENAAKIGFIAHLDTATDFADEPVNPQIIENYDGGDVVLGTSGRVLTTDSFPHLPSLKGRTLITTDGMTLLGADDKAGIAEILTAAEHILTENLPHGPISIGFTPDEEVGTSADRFDLAVFDADCAYTMDGGKEGEVVYETFNASAAVFDVKGFNIHPGSAKNRMINASLVAMEINAMLPTGDTPRDTEGYEGFFHLCNMEGSVESAKLNYIVRDHSAAMFDARLAALRHIEKVLNEKYG
ncbi:MAG: peptidase T, partial [Clostridia bacterium]|nr:peptidase T [Clostridia bacterium]